MDNIILRTMQFQGLDDIYTIPHNIDDLDGVVPIDKGGTGADNIEDARANLNVPSKDEIDRTHKFYFPDLNGSGYYSGNMCVMVSGGKTILFDVNARLNWSACKALLDKLFDDGTITNIDYIVLSHYHFDHVGADRTNQPTVPYNFIQILEEERYSHENCKCYVPISPEGYYTGTSASTYVELCNAIEAACAQNNVEYIVVESDMEVEYADNCKMNFINSTREDYQYYRSISGVDYNNFSMCTFVTFDKNIALFSGDILADAQRRIMQTHTNIPRVNLYSMHHHGIQNYDEDYLPYIEAIYPEISVVQSSSDRITVTGARGAFAVDYLGADTTILTNAYGAVSIAYYNHTPMVLEGQRIDYMGDYYQYVDLYVDNSVAKNGDGSQTNPVNNIVTALMMCKDKRNIAYRIHLRDTGATYEGVYVRHMGSYISIDSYGGEKAQIEWMYVSSDTLLEIKNLKFVGYHETHTHNTQLFVNNMQMFVDGCTFEVNSNCGELYHIYSEMGTTYVSNCTFNKGSTTGEIGCMEAYRWAKFISNGNSFNNVTRCYHTSNCEVVIRGNDTINSVGGYIVGTTSGNVPYLMTRTVAQNYGSFLTLNKSGAVSSPIYMSFQASGEESASTRLMVFINDDAYEISKTKLT